MESAWEAERQLFILRLESISQAYAEIKVYMQSISYSIPEESFKKENIDYARFVKLISEEKEKVGYIIALINGMDINIYKSLSPEFLQQEHEKVKRLF